MTKRNEPRAQRGSLMAMADAEAKRWTSEVARSTKLLVSDATNDVCEICNEQPATQKAVFVDANICAVCAEGEPNPFDGTDDDLRCPDCVENGESGKYCSGHKVDDDEPETAESQGFTIGGFYNKS